MLARRRNVRCFADLGLCRDWWSSSAPAFFRLSRSTCLTWQVPPWQRFQRTAHCLLVCAGALSCPRSFLRWHHHGVRTAGGSRLQHEPELSQPADRVSPDPGGGGVLDGAPFSQGVPYGFLNRSFPVDGGDTREMSVFGAYIVRSAAAGWACVGGVLTAVIFRLNRPPPVGASSCCWSWVAMTAPFVVAALFIGF